MHPKVLLSGTIKMKNADSLTDQALLMDMSLKINSAWTKVLKIAFHNLLNLAQLIIPLS